MEPIQSIDELTRRNVTIIAEMEKAAANFRTRGERLADRIAAWVGSWAFILTQTAVLLLWVGLNAAAWAGRWDPYPFVLLNLGLSCLSAYAAPILMVSQNRQARLAERRNHLDLQINMLAEQETTEILRLLHLICERSGIRLDDAEAGRVLEEETKHTEIVRQIQGEIEEQKGEAAEVLEEVAARGAARAADAADKASGTDAVGRDPATSAQAPRPGRPEDRGRGPG